MSSEKFLLFALIGACCLTGGFAQENCMCGWFVQAMFAPLSNLPPLDPLPGTSVSPSCALADCRTHCKAQGEAVRTVDLNENVGGKPRGQVYCETINKLTGGDVDNQPLIVLSRVPQCSSFTLWDTNEQYTSATHLCCFGPNYVACR